MQDARHQLLIEITEHLRPGLGVFGRARRQRVRKEARRHVGPHTGQVLQPAVVVGNPVHHSVADAAELQG